MIANGMSSLANSQMADIPQPRPKDFSHVWSIASFSFFLSAIATLVAPNYLHSAQLFDLAVYVFPLTGLIFGLIALTEGITKLRFYLIFAALAGLALNGGLLLSSYTLYDVYHQSSQEAFCMANLKQMESAKATWALEHDKTTNDIPADSELFGSNAYIRRKPGCPGGRIYTIGNVGQRITCPIPG